MNFIKIKPGNFLMGSPITEVGRYDDEVQREVTISEPFEIGETPVTQKQWQDIMGNNPSYFKGMSRPVETVSYSDVRACLAKLNAEKYGYTYRLPTEEEWEYCCRAGTQTPYYHPTLDEIAWFSDNSNNQTHDVACLKPNPWGLFDTCGNVWDWTSSLYSKDSSYRVFRGGSWNLYAQFLRSAYRDYAQPGSRSGNVGFRLVRTKTLPPNPLLLDSEATKCADAIREIRRIRARLTKLEKILR